MLKKFLLFVSVVMLLSSCSQSNDEQKGEVLYRYTGNLISLVDQRNEPVHREYGITFTLTMDHFYPIEAVFNKANSTYPEDHEGFRHVDFSQRTKVYIQAGNAKTRISPLELSNFANPMGQSPQDAVNQRLEVWITPYQKNDWFIEAVEVVVLEE